MIKFLDDLRTTGVSPALVVKMIEEHKTDSKRMQGLYERYKASIEGVPILSRKPIASKPKRGSGR